MSGFASKDEAEYRIVSNGGKINGSVIVFSKPGLKILSAIDFLVAKHGYIWVQKEPK